MIIQACLMLSPQQWRTEGKGEKTAPSSANKDPQKQSSRQGRDEEAAEELKMQHKPSRKIWLEKM